MKDNDFYWYWFANIPGIGLKTRKKLLEYFRHPKYVYEASDSEIKVFLTKKQWERFPFSKNREKSEKEVQRLQEEGIFFIHRESPEYAERLKQLYMPPDLLYYKGRFPDFSKPVLAMVGARKATIYGRNMAREFASELTGYGIQIISGMAAGVDTSSHLGALDAGGYTAGVLGGGIDSIYPRENFNLYQKVCKTGGIISEYNVGIPSQKGMFPMRNRIISGMADGVFVVEAGERSGSLITADQGLEQGKDIFALPGRITDRYSQGCNYLISQGGYSGTFPRRYRRNYSKRGKNRKYRTGYGEKRKQKF